MRQNVTKIRPFYARPLEWTPAREKALRLVVEGRLTDEQIARQVGVCRRTLGYWKVHPDFIAAWQRIVNEYAAQLRRDAVRRVLGRGW